ncbi:MAG: hypothetical protein ISR97_02165 [Nitrospira sp.]|nr:hypothetical protein [bacterium]MBL7031968.1 hypothetical protein [Nitrospira sp.]
MKKITFSIAAATILLIIILGGIYGGMSDRSNASLDTETVQNETARADMPALMATMNILQINEPTLPPDFSLMSVAEEEISLNQQKGKVTLLSFWATW